MKIGEMSYDLMPLPDSTPTGELIPVTVVYGQDKRITSTQQHVMVYKGPFPVPGAVSDAKDPVTGEVQWHTRDGQKTRPKRVRGPDTVEMGEYHLLPVGETGVVQVVRLSKDWREEKARENARTFATSSDGMAEQIAVMQARMERMEADRQREKDDLAALTKTLGLQPGDLKAATNRARS